VKRSFGALPIKNTGSAKDRGLSSLFLYHFLKVYLPPIVKYLANARILALIVDL
jgi:hypothetical protein